MPDFKCGSRTYSAVQNGDFVSEESMGIENLIVVFRMYRTLLRQGISHSLCQWCIFLEDQGVGREVIRGHVAGKFQVLFPVLQCLPGDIENQIEIQLQPCILLDQRINILQVFEGALASQNLAYFRVE